MYSVSVMINELSSLNELEKYINNGKNITLDIARNLLHTNRKESSEDMLKQLSEYMLEFLALEREMSQFQDAASIVKQKLANKDLNEHLDVDTTLENAISEIAKNNTDMALKQHPSYQDLKSIIDQYMQQENNEDQELCDDNDAIIVKQSSGRKDPITQVDIKDPVKNIHCKHVYDKTSILKYIKSKEKKRCPYIGCTNPHPLHQKDLI